jgi:hypothetical protein
MRVPTWRLVLAGGVVVILAALGIGLVAAANAPAALRSNVAAAVATPGPAATTEPGRPEQDRRGERREAWRVRLLRIGRHLVHVEATVTDKDGNLIVLRFDHGTVQSFNGGSLSISEAGGGTGTVTTDDATVVHVGRADGMLANVTVGDEVFVQSRVDGNKTLAKRILIIPPRSS